MKGANIFIHIYEGYENEGLLIYDWDGGIDRHMLQNIFQ